MVTLPWRRDRRKTHRRPCAALIAAHPKLSPQYMHYAEFAGGDGHRQPSADLLAGKDPYRRRAPLRSVTKVVGASTAGAAMATPRMVHYLGGPLDGHTALMDASRHPFMISLSSDTDGYYVMKYQVAGQQIGDLELTNDDVIAEWHQRSSPDDFQTGDTVIVIATGEHATVLLPTTVVHEDGSSEDLWMISVDGRERFVRPGEIRIARPDELGQGDA